MVFWSGSKSRGQIDGVTADDNYTCPKCTYTGRLLLRLLERKKTVYSIPVTGWNEKGGWLVCPACGNAARQLGKRKYRELPKVNAGPELVAALHRIDDAVKRQFPRVSDHAQAVATPEPLNPPTAQYQPRHAAPELGSGTGPASTPRHAARPLSASSTERPAEHQVNYDIDYDLTEWAPEQRTRLTRLLDATGIPFSLRNLHLLVDRRFESEVDHILDSMKLN